MLDPLFEAEVVPPNRRGAIRLEIAKSPHVADAQGTASGFCGPGAQVIRHARLILEMRRDRE
jgi:hypothetical protein